MSENDLECRGWLLGESPNAIHVTDKKHSGSWWIPRSLVGYQRKSQEKDGTAIIFTCPEWKIEQAQMWDLVP
jgi:hypothetical protein